MQNRITELLGIRYPIIQAPMGWIARSPLASAVSNAGGLGIIETSSGDVNVIKSEMALMQTLTDKPFGVNIAQAFIWDSDMVDHVIASGVRFVTTSAGNPAKYVKSLKAADITVFHVVPDLASAQKAIDAGVDGLIVEGGEGGGFKSTNPVSTMVLLPLIRENFDVPIIAAGGIKDGVSMAAAFALGAEGVQMGTRMLSCAESPVHNNWKQAVIDASETDTLLLNQHGKPTIRALRTATTEKLFQLDDFNAMDYFAAAEELYFGGDMNASIASTGQVAGRIHAVKPVKTILDETMAGFREVIDNLQNLLNQNV